MNKASGWNKHCKVTAKMLHSLRGRKVFFCCLSPYTLWLWGQFGRACFSSLWQGDFSGVHVLVASRFGDMQSQHKITQRFLNLGWHYFFVLWWMWTIPIERVPPVRVDLCLCLFAKTAFILYSKAVTQWQSFLGVTFVGKMAEVRREQHLPWLFYASLWNIISSEDCHLMS